MAAKNIAVADRYQETTTQITSSGLVDHLHDGEREADVDRASSSTISGISAGRSASPVMANTMIVEERGDLVGARLDEHEGAGKAVSQSSTPRSRSTDGESRGAVTAAS